MRMIFHHDHPVLRSIPGPLALASTRNGAIWAVGGGRGVAAVLRYSDESGWVKHPVEASGLRAVLPLSDESAVVVGEYGFAAVVGPGASVRRFATDTSDCLFTIARDRNGRVWAAGDNGTLLELRPGAVLEVERVASGTTECIVQLDQEGPARVMVTANSVIHGAKTVLTTRTRLTRFARGPETACAVSGDDGQLFIGATIDSLVAVDASSLGRGVECIVYDATSEHFVVGGTNTVGRVTAEGRVTVVADLVDAGAVTSLLPWKGGVLATAWLQTGAPYRFLGTLFFVGEDGDAPTRVIEPPRQPIPEPRTRTVGVETVAFLSAGDAEMVSLEEAKRRLPDLSWPDTQHEQVRYYAGSVRVANTDALLTDTADLGFAVVIEGDLVIDGYLDGGAGGNGYDSIVIVSGSVWAESAYFRSCITVVCKALEVATAIMCAYGDDGGSLWVDSVRAQVFHYSTYFSKPGCPIDAFCVGDVYGERSFPPERGVEVFVTEVLDEGSLDERVASDWLEAGKSIVRPPAPFEPRDGLER